MSIMNLTQYSATTDQVVAGVFDLPAEARQYLARLLTFDRLPKAEEILDAARYIAAMAALYASPDDREEGGLFADQAMIGGAPYLMAPLADALMDQGITPVFAFSVSEREERKQADGSFREATVSRHAGFVPAITTPPPHARGTLTISQHAGFGDYRDHC